MSTQPLTSNRLEFDDAVEVMEYYFDQGWTDGLPVVPPTVDRVAEFLDAAGRSASDIVGTEPTKGRVITAEKVAINAVMAGCRPEYFPVVVAAIEAMSEPQFNLHAISVSTMGAAVMTVVSGPIARELSLNSGVNVFGPGNRANATIGRAVRLVMMNVTGAEPGELDKATLGHAGKYTWCIAEAEEASPWEPLHVERGFDHDQSAVSVFAGLSPFQTSLDPESMADGFADALALTGSGQQEVVLVLSLEAIGHLKNAGWSKARTKEMLFEATRKHGAPVTASPDGITLIVAGGAAGGACAIIQLWGGGSNSQSVTKQIASLRPPRSLR